MSFPELIESKKNYKFKPNDICDSLYKGACVKIKNSQKIFQVVGINPKSKVCWIREWPFAFENNKTFSLEINQITLQTFCSKNFTEKNSM
tara:strand:+ start:104 stop:373 length:270 start_codon:yes stop_codon:yes gene_type:complete